MLACAAAVLRSMMWIAELVLLPSQEIWDGPGTSWDWLRIFGSQDCFAGMLSSMLFWMGAASAVLALSWMSGQALLWKDAAVIHPSFACFATFCPGVGLTTQCLTIPFA